MHRKSFVWFSLLLIALATGVAGAATAANKSKKDVTLNLVAYSTPRPVLTKLIEEFRKTPRGPASTSARPTARPRPRARRSRTGCPPTG